MLIWIVGIAFAWRARGRYPVRSRLAVIGFTVLLLTEPVFILVRAMVGKWLYSQSFDAPDLSTIFMVIGIAKGIAIAIGGAFLIAALFGPRANRRKEIEQGEPE
ncbi:MAG: hypothetical protein ABIQ57_05705 [Candidatus Kapaibacterium sp.]